MRPATASDDDGGGGRLSVRVLVGALVAQVVVFAGLAAVTLHGFPFFGGAAHTASRPQANLAAVVPRPTVNRFDAARAMRIAKLQVDAGPRPAASPALRRVAEKLRTMLPGGHFEDVPGNPGMRNVIGEIPGSAPAIVIGAHYETINRPKGFVGANDSAAAVGAVIEIARDLAHMDRPPGAPAVRFVLFDGEEELRPTNDFYRDALRGSKAYVQLHAEELRAMILLDYIGQKGLRLPREASSTRSLWDSVRGAAKAVGVIRVFPPTTEVPIFDDHTPFLRAGIPAVDLIDWSWPYQHTLKDTYDKLSAASVDAVGETIVELIRRWPPDPSP